MVRYKIKTKAKAISRINLEVKPYKTALKKEAKELLLLINTFKKLLGSSLFAELK